MWGWLILIVLGAGMGWLLVCAAFLCAGRVCLAGGQVVAVVVGCVDGVVPQRKRCLRRGPMAG